MLRRRVASSQPHSLGLQDSCALWARQSVEPAAGGKEINSDRVLLEGFSKGGGPSCLVAAGSKFAHVLSDPVGSGCT